MTFSMKVKDELTGVHVKKDCCRIAETAGALVARGVFVKSADRVRVTVSGESKNVADRVCSVAGKLGYEVEMYRDSGKSRDVYTAAIGGDVFNLMRCTGSMPFNAETVSGLTHSECCRSAFVRGAFLAAGSITDPTKGNHLETVFQNAPCAEFTANLLTNAGIGAKLTQRRDQCPVYVKEGESIASMLALMGAHSAMLEYESLLVEREVRNKINRENNCVTANIDKTATAYAKQRYSIRLIDECLGIENLPPALIEIARVRLEHPEATLNELADMIGSTRSGVNHRLRRLVDMARAFDNTTIIPGGVHYD